LGTVERAAKGEGISLKGIGGAGKGRRKYSHSSPVPSPPLSSAP